jgi:hypothetical protein
MNRTKRNLRKKKIYRNSNTRTPNRRSYNKTSKQIEPDLKMNCSPAVEGKTPIKGSCYTTSVLEKIKTEYNKGHANDQITTNHPVEIWNQLKYRLQTCDKEDCWLTELKDEAMRKKIDKYIFAPDQPPEWKSNPNEWLSNVDIFEVIVQYEDTDKYSDFYFMGPTPIDFDAIERKNNANPNLSNAGGKCITPEICKFSLKQQMKSGKRRFGIIFNLDKHNQRGSHWVSLYIDVNDKFIFYFDSAGSDIPKEIEVLKDRIIAQGKELDPSVDFVFHKNYPNDHQKGNTECGMYSLFFIITMLTGNSEFGKNMSLEQKIDLFKLKKIPDKYVEKYRNKYFNKK